MQPGVEQDGQQKSEEVGTLSCPRASKYLDCLELQILCATAATLAAAAVCCCQVRQKLAGVKADCFLATTLDEVAWLYNLRGSDVPYNPGET
jgi:hypothetical protein